MRGQTHRLPEGGRIDREKPMRFSFNNQVYDGYMGDTLASALLANGVRLVGRSFKYHRPRGIFSAGAEEMNALVQLEHGAFTQPNLRATQIELYAGLKADSINCWPSVGFDLWSINGVLGRLFPAGFYYKTFMWPSSLWPFYGRFIRRAAGLGHAPAEPDPDRYEIMNTYCDVLVVGGGPAGLSAAAAAGRTGARVILADEQNEFGGALLNGGQEIDSLPAMDWVENTISDLQDRSEVRLLPRTNVFGYFDHNFLAAVERVTDHLGSTNNKAPRQHYWRIRAKQVILGTGAIERPLVFEGNDRPGVMLAGAVRTYINRYGIRPAKAAVIFTNNDGAYQTALDLITAGARVHVVDIRSEINFDWEKQMRAAGIEILKGCVVIGTRGTKRIKEVTIAEFRSDKQLRNPLRLDCDLVAVSGGWNPTVHLFSQSGGSLRYDDNKTCLIPDASRKPLTVVGSADGSFELGNCLSEGLLAGADAAKITGFNSSTGNSKTPSTTFIPEQPIESITVVPSKNYPNGGPGHFVDLQNDVTVSDISLASREGYSAVEHLKRYTTLGMGTDQGKTSNVAALAILSGLRGEAVSEVGHTTYRPPYTPVGFGVLAGREIGRFADPIRRTPMYHWHLKAEAIFEDVGQWKRPWFYPVSGEDMNKAVERECLATRQSVGILDASTLGKIEIQGPDAADFLNLVYVNNWHTLEIGRCRYGLMLGEDGMVLDDGVTARLGENRFLVTTTTGGAARVNAWFEEWLQTEWPEMRVYLTSVTEHWATITLAGPNTRMLLGELTEDISLDQEEFPFMTWRVGTVSGVPARVFRVSFTGELSFEINVPANYAVGVWEACIAAGEKYNITPFGTEAMHVLRAEKGYIVVGQETDGTVAPEDLGMEGMLSKKKDFIGRRSLRRTDTARKNRKQLVGLETDEPLFVVPIGTQILDQPETTPPMDMIGHVTSSYYSANLKSSIALALIRNGRHRHGERVYLPVQNKTVNAIIRSPVFFDPEGKRLNG